ncbi:uroporphyrinogen-III synthase [Paracoccus sp. S-4012]|uniref:uroporphyrinogen-III synthase n=1 Tax=Paracoccus sp. S-4012 TaxID=2665648 RepID=UPI001E30DF28|nr:uroporphyrinogen-III synthase [Paracoccus sp. S-4012]
MPPPVLLLTRPEPASRRFAEEVADLGLRTVIAPLMRIEPVAHDAQRAQAAPVVVLTSVAAVPAAGTGAGRRAICVGDATAAAAREAGFVVETGATGEASGLLPLIAACDTVPLHLRGRHVAAELPGPSLIVYDQVALPLPEAGRAVLDGEGPVLLPLFSPRSAALAAEAAAGARAQLVPLAISAAAARAWGGAMPVAARPDGASMRALVAAAVAEQSRREPG